MKGVVDLSRLELGEQLTDPSASILVNGVRPEIDPNTVSFHKEQARFLAEKGSDVTEATRFMVAEPGVITTDSAEEAADNESAHHISPDTQLQLTNPREIGHGSSVHAGAYLMVTGATMSVDLNRPDGAEVSINLPRRLGRSWMLFIRGLDGDGEKDTDYNLPVTITDYDPGFALATRLPAGAQISADYVNQNVETAHTQNCGDDGCSTVDVVLYDVRTDAFSVVRNEMDGDDSSWQLVDSNFSQPEN
ncbi:MAG: hypothetical protein COU69_02890 [Candidatus Pacebacteria bacterium CG10_big_fil_rev_8_21_14_0_10_56_10]|nr:MAG: hypothetical protein COU69_02890 [Candidatus Pacebacteria bacterium CG10_big_fil_rev_8_21_14_0_10_56_10]